MLTIGEQVFLILRSVNLEESCRSQWLEFKAAFDAGMKTVL